MLTRYRRQNVEGARLLVGERWDARSQRWLPLYPDLIAHPRHTPAGRRVLLCLEDACAHAVLDDSGCRDCGSCRHYRLQPGGLLGTCGHPSQGAPPRPTAPQRRLPRAPAANRGKTRRLDQRQRKRRTPHETIAI